MSADQQSVEVFSPTRPATKSLGKRLGASSSLAAPVVALDQHSAASPQPGAGQLYDKHGAALHYFARAVSLDSASADTLVVAAITLADRDSTGASITLRELAASVYAEWVRGAAISTPSTIRPMALEPIDRLPDNQRVALALCVFGDHSCFQAADVLHIGAQEAAGLLRKALLTLT